MTTRSLLALSLMASLASGCASTHYESRRSTSSGDGSNSDAAWAALDTNADGFLSVDELERQHAVGLLGDWSNADADHDGQLSRAEWNAWWPMMTKTEPSPNMAPLNASSAPANGVRAD